MNSAEIPPALTAASSFDMRDQVPSSQYAVFCQARGNTLRNGPVAQGASRCTLPDRSIAQRRARRRPNRKNLARPSASLTFPGSFPGIWMPPCGYSIYEGPHTGRPGVPPLQNAPQHDGTLPNCALLPTARSLCYSVHEDSPPFRMRAGGKNRRRRDP